MKKVIRIVASLLLVTSMLVACQPKRHKVAYTVYPVQFLLEEIGGERVETYAFSNEKNVMRSQLVEDYKDIIKNVDTIFTIGGLEPYLDIINQDILDYSPNVIDLGSKGAVIPFGRYSSGYLDSVVVEAETQYYENPLFENIDTYTNDPYIWLDPIMMTSMANEILTYFVSIDPDNTDYYQSNFENLKMELAYLDANYAELKQNNNVAFASMIPAFGRYANNYGYSVSPIMISKYGNLPTKAQLEVIKVRLINDGVRYLIIEDNLDKDIVDMANSLADELDLEILNVSSLSALTTKQINEGLNYIDVMNENLQVLKTLGKTTE